MTAVRGSHRELEAQTPIKRGYLNLIHAREAIAAAAGADRAESAIGTRSSRPTTPCSGMLGRHHNS